RAHFCRLSTAKAERLIARAQYDGLPVTADVSAHQLHLSDMDIGEFDAQYHVKPPLRSMRDRDGLRKGIKAKSIAAICSDHQPHDPDAKIGPFSATQPGISALETLLPLSLRLVRDKVLSLNEALAALTCEPAKILGLEAGSLEPGAIADICVYDPEFIWTLDKNDMRSAGRNTPFHGWEFEGKVKHTLFAGQLVYSNE
ncbi:MAG: amidohydrolase family protein, partial [Gammaproteobacteria bacterium]|nr:amidohydrolase family protein [Gammaproteobacteria bacterium]